MSQATAPVAIPDIQKLANQIVERFKPYRVILFGSYAIGTPTADSDVDLLVVTRCSRAQFRFQIQDLRNMEGIRRLKAGVRS